MAAIAIAGASAVLRQAVVELSKVVTKEGSRLFRVTEDLEWIDNEMRYIEAYLQDIEDKQWKTRGLTNLVRNIWDIAYDVEEIVNTYFPKLESRGRNGRKGLLGCLTSAKWFCTNLNTARGFAVEIEGIKKRVGDIDRVRSTYGIKDKSGDDKGDIWDPRRSFPHTDDVNVAGPDADIKQWVERVASRDIRHLVVFPVVGMPGMGKTTLARRVYNYVRTLDRVFDRSAWIYVSQQPNISKLFLDLAKDVLLGDEESRHNLEEDLYNFLCNQRFLIVVDDIWKTEAWDDLLKVIPTSSEKGSRIILTSQINSVGEYAGGPNSLHVLKSLTEDCSQQLFRSVVGEPQQDDPPELNCVGNKILNKCRGVPLTIKLIAGVLKQTKRTVVAWSGVLESMGQLNQYSAIPELSYKDLPTKLKPCFLYFGLFPENYEILASEMINLWVAEGLIQRGPGMREVEEVGEDYLNQFAARNMISVERSGEFDGRITSCSIHDVLRSVCVKVAKDINFFNTHIDVADTRNLSTTKVRRITADLHIPLYYRTPKLRAMLCFHREDQSELISKKGLQKFLEDLKKLLGDLLCFDRENQSKLSKEDLEKFLGDLKFLRVLSLEYKFLEISLPSEIGNLRYLTCIRLRVRYAKLPSAISNLRDLQTLDGRECSHLVIPNCIWNIKQLRHVLLSPTCKIKFYSGGLHLYPIEASPSNLQTLYSLTVSRRPGPRYWFPKLFTDLRKLGVSFSDGDLSKVKVLLDAATTVKILRLDGESQAGAKQYNILDLNLCRYKNLFRLHLEGRTVELPEHDKLPPNLTKLTLVHTYLEKDPMETLKKLPNLKILKLGEKSYLQPTMLARSREEGDITDTFPQLEVLVIDRLNVLMKIEVTHGAMPRLRKIKITGYDRRPAVRMPNRNRNIVSFE